MQQRSLLRRVLRRVFETVVEKVRRCLAMGFNGKKGSEKPLLRRGSKKGLSRRHLEGRSTPFQSTTPLACALETGVKNGLEKVHKP